METVIARLLKRFGRKAIELEVEEELRFHLELRTQEHLQQGMSLAEAKDAAAKRFGDAELIKDQCVEISRRNHPLMRALKSFSILVFLAGVLVRVSSADDHVNRVGEVLMMIAVLGRLLFYVRGLSSSNFSSTPETTLRLRWRENPQTPTAAYGEGKRTPIERVIFDE